MTRPERLAALRQDAPTVLPSLLLCDFAHLGREVAALEKANVKALHLDVMDGHFVPNFTYGLPLVEAFRGLTELPLDVHMMVSRPAEWVERFAEAGADSMTIHVEAEGDTAATLQQIRDLGCGVGLALNPQTPLRDIEPYLGLCDIVLVMSVSPGFGGQSFEPVALEKLKQLRQQLGNRVLLEVDGGVNLSTAGDCAASGADLFVVGSAIFKTDDYGQSVAQLNESIATARRNAGADPGEVSSGNSSRNR